MHRAETDIASFGGVFLLKTHNLILIMRTTEKKNKLKGFIQILVASLVAQTVKCLPAMRETQPLSLGQEDPLEKEMATHSSILAWKIPRTEESGGLQSTGWQRVGHDWATSLSFIQIHWTELFKSVKAVRDKERVKNCQRSERKQEKITTKCTPG